MNLPFKADLSGKVVVITGAGGVLCSVFAKALGECGAKVALLDRNMDSAECVAQEIRSQGGQALAYACDVLSKTDLESVREAVNRDLGPCTILVNGAGGNNPRATTDNEFFSSADLGHIKTFFDLELEGVDLVFRLNVMGTLLPSQVFAPDMLDQTGASIINISSMNAFTPLTKIPAYSGAKAAVSNLTQWLAVHFSKVGIRCNAIAPGFFVTAQNQKLLFHPDGSPTERTAKILGNTPMGRFGKAEELLGALLFLADVRASSFVNGVILPVDGGFSSYSGV